MEDRSRQMLVLNIIFMTVTTTVVALRVYCRGWIIKSFGIDDQLMVVSWVCCACHWWPTCLEYAWYRSQLSFTAYLISQHFGLSYGTGKGRDLLSASDNRNALLVCYRSVLQIERKLSKMANIIRRGMCVNYFTSSARVWSKYPSDFSYYAYQSISSIYGSFDSLSYRQ